MKSTTFRVTGEGYFAKCVSGTGVLYLGSYKSVPCSEFVILEQKNLFIGCLQKPQLPELC